jgi:hypothetical protein
MSDEFEKWHLGDGRVLHRFTGPDRGGPHDHQFAIDIEVLTGGYTERVWQPDGSSKTVERRSGDRFRIEAEHIHEIVSLTNGDCLTIAEYGSPVRECRFWRFDGAPRSRAWHERWEDV